MKICIRCKIPQPLENFGGHAREADGRHYYCRTCANSISNANRYAHGTKPSPPFLERLWKNIQQCGHEDLCIYCCWPWMKTRDKNGYGRICVSNQNQITNPPVTRVVYEIWHARQVPSDIFVCHYCDFPPCCNPSHLWLGTALDNRQDCVKKERQYGGIRHYRSKLTEDNVRNIRNLYPSSNISATKLAKEFGVSKHTIIKVSKRKTYKSIL